MMRYYFYMVVLLVSQRSSHSFACVAFMAIIVVNVMGEEEFNIRDSVHEHVRSRINNNCINNR